MTLRVGVLCAFLAVVAACDGRGLSSSPSAMPVGPSGVAASPASGSATASSAAPLGAGRSVQSHQDVRVNIEDACDPTSFDAVLGAGACTRSGGMKFDDFIATLTRLGFVGPWHFAPNNANVDVGATFQAINLGGETHTFTEVAEYGGGIVASLNQLAHVPVEAPECAALEGDDFVPPGGLYTETVDETGTVKFQCCIHPWMRFEAQVSAK
jgi:plastocyanin